jgi:Leucine Rich repeat
MKTLDIECTEENRSDVLGLLTSLTSQDIGECEHVWLTSDAGNAELEALSGSLLACAKSSESSIALQLLEVGSGVTELGIKSLVAALFRCANLKELYLASNVLRSRGADTLAKGLCRAEASVDGAQVATLVLAQCELGDDGVEAIARSLPACLEILHLEANNVSDAGAVALANALNESGNGAGLCELLLDHNRIGVKGARALLDAVRRRHGQLRVSLGHNDALPDHLAVLPSGTSTPLGRQSSRSSLSNVAAVTAAASFEGNAGKSPLIVDDKATLAAAAASSSSSSPASVKDAPAVAKPSAPAVTVCRRLSFDESDIESDDDDDKERKLGASFQWSAFLAGIVVGVSMAAGTLIAHNQLIRRGLIEQSSSS